ncbi:hypothetical protein J2X36_003964 [Methylobacterium sp. BE186]|uniref:hypothetical protein n=1 Tax=Methylobacterium sp. BE186 TaxID=2817715 RepID=UPI002861CEE1|nr:hypothetical protein [Methylobacterium sp. BE186]MDR7039191.1 hypothetical protein [Methylobacterium sp. BE186]
MTSEKTQTTSSKPAENSTSALIVFGLDESGKPHASSFTEADAALAERAAGLMGMRCLKVATDEHRAEAARLPQGRVFASGRAFVPFVKAALYARLTAMQGHTAPEPAPVGATPDTPQAKGSPNPSLEGHPVAGSGITSKPPAELPHAGSTHRPTNWEQIRVGSVVLAPEHDEESWWPAIVMNMPSAERLILKWRDTFDEPAFARQRSQIGLLNPASLAAQA